MLHISEAVRIKLATRHKVSEAEVMEAFANRDGGLLEDTRAQNQTIPPTLWFVAQTHRGRLLKIVFIRDGGRVFLKTAYEPNIEEQRIYEKYKD